MSDTNDAPTGNTNARYSSCAEITRETIKYSMASLQECVGGTQNPEVPERAQIKIIPRATGLFCLTVGMGDLRQSDRL